MTQSVIYKNSSQDLFDKAKRIFPGGVNSPVRAFEPNPFFVSYARGSKLFSVDKRSYIDYCMAYGALLLGHANEEILEAVKASLKNGTLYGAPTEMEVEFAENIQDILPTMEMLRLVNSGTEATMHAIRVARGFTKRKKIVKFDGCFHGSHDSVLVKAGSGATTFGMPNSLGVPEETARNTIVIPYNDVAALEEVIEKNSDEIASVIMEPLMGNVGLILPQKNYLNYVRKITAQHGVILILDEIITGFRVALGGAQEYFGVKPDLTTLGKVLGGGFPLACFGGKKEIMECVAPSGKVYQAGTFSGNPLSVTAGNSVLRLLRKRKERIYPILEEKSARLSNVLRDFASDFHLDAQINNISSMFQVFFTSKPVVDCASAKSSDLTKFQKYFASLLREGVFIPPSQFETCFLSMSHSDSDFEATEASFEKALRAVI